MAEVFISYKREERALIAPIVTRLGELGVDVWYDHKVPAGTRFSTFIDERLGEASTLAWWRRRARQSCGSTRKARPSTRA
jgi:hypothetical protein